MTYLSIKFGHSEKDTKFEKNVFFSEFPNFDYLKFFWKIKNKSGTYLASADL